MPAHLALRGVAAGLGVRGPAHPLVVEDGVGPHLVRHDHRLEGVGLRSYLLFNLDTIYSQLSRQSKKPTKYEDGVLTV